MDRSSLKIGIYVVARAAKQTYANDCFDVRLNVGVQVVKDFIGRAGFTDVGYCGARTVADYDVVLVSLTSDCDWWPFVSERLSWPAGRYKVVVGGPGVLNARPFLTFVDFLQLGRCEPDMVNLLDAIRMGADYESEFTICAATFSMGKTYRIAQVDSCYPHEVLLTDGSVFREEDIGCNHKCLFCGYTWHRKHANDTTFAYGGLWTRNTDVERAIIDLANGVDVNLNKLRTVAIDGMSERLRNSVNKRITREMLREFMRCAATCDKPHQIKIYNIVGYPTETRDDWMELLDDMRRVDEELPRLATQKCSWLLHSTPFRPTPCTPLACEPMSLRNYRGEIARILGGGRHRGNVFYRGGATWAVESMGTESLPTVMLSAIAIRGVESDSESVRKLCANWRRLSAADAKTKEATLRRYFDVERLFSRYDTETLPTRNIRTYCAVEKMWNKHHFEEK